METVQSADGTTIAYDRFGQGPALVMVTGAFCDRQSFRSLAACLEPDFTVHLYDRRGRGGSSDADTYAVEREVEDLAAVLAAAGGAASVFGHSSGAALALEAAAVGVEMRRLAVYEPPYTGDGKPTSGLADELRELAASGRREEAATRFLETTGAPPEVIDMIKAGPDWPGMLAIAHTLAYDITLSNGGVLPVERLAEDPGPHARPGRWRGIRVGRRGRADDRCHDSGRVVPDPSRARARSCRRGARPDPADVLHVLTLGPLTGCPPRRRRRTRPRVLRCARGRGQRQRSRARARTAHVSAPVPAPGQTCPAQAAARPAGPRTDRGDWIQRSHLGARTGPAGPADQRVRPADPDRTPTVRGLSLHASTQGRRLEAGR